MDWPTVQQIHSQTAADLISAAEHVPQERWLTPRAEGKWTPAEILEHLSLAYDVLLRELAGGGGMAIRTKLWQQIFLKLTMVPKILRGGAFPAGARAPRETRPAAANPDKAAAIAAFRTRAAQFDAVASNTQATKPRLRLTHAYFGKASVKNSVLLCARHVQHHLKQLGG